MLHSDFPEGQRSNGSLEKKTKTYLPASLDELSPNEAIRLLIVRWLVLDEVSSLTCLLLSNFDVWGNSVKCSVSQQLMRKTCLWRWQSRAGPHREEATLWIDQLNLIYVASPGRVGRSEGWRKGCVSVSNALQPHARIFFFFPQILCTKRDVQNFVLSCLKKLTAKHDRGIRVKYFLKFNSVNILKSELIFSWWILLYYRWAF